MILSLATGFVWSFYFFGVFCQESFNSHAFLPAQVSCYRTEKHVSLILNILHSRAYLNQDHSPSIQPFYLKVNLGLWEASKAVSEEQDAIRLQFIVSAMSDHLNQVRLALYGPG